MIASWFCSEQMPNWRATHSLSGKRHRTSAVWPTGVSKELSSDEEMSSALVGRPHKGFEIDLVAASRARKQS